ncbi:probable serpin E3 [Ictalurus punctatus]|uniref:Probable serpin E3 n=1 Tax=Ictalurus punctatus TaxID=7998 RepID=A0A2D0RWN7_ICTPU|nr:probable serpin E3 [Ictalurus punctatus]XP_053536831.1 probable serpin E3 [Ictalurus punctatus]
MCHLSMTSFFFGLLMLEQKTCNGSSVTNFDAEFSISLYQALAETDNSSNLIVSPASISLSLRLLQLGARGNTLAQIERTMGYDINDPTIQEAVSQARCDLYNSSQGGRLQFTNTLLIQSGIQLQPEFTQHAMQWCNSSLISVNFSLPNHTQVRFQQVPTSRGEAKEVMQASWWATVPHMALLSSVDFQGSWQKQFLFRRTQNLPFSLANGSNIKVPMMYQSTEVKFGQFHLPSDQRYSVLELPYSGQSLSLLLVIPSERKTPLSLFQTQLTRRTLAIWNTGLRHTKMDIFLPRFKLHYQVNLKPVLELLGISDAFDPISADFRGISDTEGFYVSEAVHKAMIDVTENGTAAAAATAMVLLKRSRASVFKVDRPFLFILRCVNGGSVLFIGRVMNPAKE